MREAKEEELI